MNVVVVVAAAADVAVGYVDHGFDDVRAWTLCLPIEIETTLSDWSMPPLLQLLLLRQTICPLMWEEAKDLNSSAKSPHDVIDSDVVDAVNDDVAAVDATGAMLPTTTTTTEWILSAIVVALG